jgi:hypothetical protein
MGLVQQMPEVKLERRKKVPKTTEIKSEKLVFDFETFSEGKFFHYH